jgi:5,10-methylenetetrahydrofolate reductase
MKLTELFDKGEFVITSEVGPVKGCLRNEKGDELPQCAKEAEQVKKCVHAINVTDNQSAVMRLGSLAASVKLKTKGFEPIYQMTCRDRNRIALQSDLKFNVPIQYGIVIIKSPQMAKFMNDNVSGINVPDSIIKAMDSVSQEDRKKKAIEITIDLVKKISPMAQGVHFMPLGCSDIIPTFVKNLS